MKFTYAYKTSDGVRHEDSMEASSREEVFAVLRGRGIKAIKVVAADGSKANGAPPPGGWAARTFGGRGAAALSVTAVVAIGVAAWLAWRRGPTPPPDAQNRAPAGFLVSSTRRQVIGDAAVVEKGIRTGWADVFGREGDRFLASFAIPGVKAGQRSTSEEEMKRVLGEAVPPKDGDSLEARQIKAMVEGMKAEARGYIAAGGTAVGYGRRLVERQEAEIAIYDRVRAEALKARGTMAEDAFETYLDERNDELRNLGIRPVVPTWDGPGDRP